MNKEYKIINDEVIVIDEYGKETTRKNNDKIDEILISENKIELLNDKIIGFVREKRLENNSLKEIEKNIRYNNLWNFILLIISIFIALLLNMNLAEYLFIFSLTYLFRITATISEYIDFKHIKKRIKGLNVGKKSLEEELSKEREKLKQLNLEKEFVKSSGLVVKKVDDREELSDISKLANIYNIYYDCGYHEDEYMRYYKNNCLERKLMKTYTFDEMEIEIIKENFQDKIIVDSKKKVRKR